MPYGDILTPEELGPSSLPPARGPLTSWLFTRLARPRHELGSAPPAGDDPLYGDDAALALYCLYELHYRGFAGVDERWEWEPTLLATRARWEAAVEARLRDEVGAPTAVGDITAALYGLLDGPAGRSLSAYLAESGSREQLTEYAVHRSAYQLKEADPHSWALPRLAGGPKAALIEIQADEYGEGAERDMHQTLFAITMRELGLSPAYHAYLDRLPGPTLATTNLVSLLGLHRRLRGALVGHLAIFEMTSVEPMGRYSAALRRHGFSSAARHFYDVHVVADAHHQRVAATALAGGLAAQQPELAGDILFGARAVTAVERAFADNLLDSWQRGESSLVARAAVAAAS
ncbi:MAG: iron-containing redox enzyme family protein [Actinomycetota bacterium]|nr:iron-containing redox enzyme family protein [Actinomycetota bacterium]